MRTLVLCVLAALLLVLPVATASGPDAAAPRFACTPRGISFPPNPFVPTSPAGLLYAGATGAVNGAVITGEGAACGAVFLTIATVNGLCTRETGQPCIIVQ
ncbi:MAG: hypothetical protein QOE90_1473 [Thermoplasmata archaeon]|jgi:hypothetical protein|nr:hypothetical protein [Thermoplasmata archaeon]